MYEVSNDSQFWNLPPLNPAEVQIPQHDLPQAQNWPTSEQDVVERIWRDDEYVAQAIIALYQRQENKEKAQRKTISRNRVGFSAADVKLFSLMSERLLAGHSLSSDELAICREPMKNGLPRLAKYRRQLANANRGGVQ